MGRGRFEWLEAYDYETTWIVLFCFVDCSKPLERLLLPVMREPAHSRYSDFPRELAVILAIMISPVHS